LRRLARSEQVAGKLGGRYRWDVSRVRICRQLPEPRNCGRWSANGARFGKPAPRLGRASGVAFLTRYGQDRAPYDASLLRWRGGVRGMSTNLTAPSSYSGPGDAAVLRRARSERPMKMPDGRKWQQQHVEGRNHLKQRLVADLLGTEGERTPTAGTEKTGVYPIMLVPTVKRPERPAGPRRGGGGERQQGR